MKDGFGLFVGRTTAEKSRTYLSLQADDTSLRIKRPKYGDYNS